MINVGIMGVTGYAGEELLRLLTAHPDVKIEYLGSHSAAGTDLSNMYKGYYNTVLPKLEDIDVEAAAKRCDVVFTALPHGASSTVIPGLVNAGAKVIDLSGDYRYDDVAVYEKWYKTTHPSPELNKTSVYGLPELHRASIAKAKLIGNPGCYTTCSILGLAPLMKHKAADADSIIIDAKSGATGAGRGLSEQTHYCELTESMKAYGVGTHRHTSEIEQELSTLYGEQLTISFTPHLLPIKRGIFATCYAKLNQALSQEDVLQMYTDMYKDEPFVTVYKEGLPELKHVVGSNKVAIGLVVDRRTSRVVVVSCIDNLIKGAAGQAVQNMNLILGLPETTALTMLPWQI